MSWLEGRALAAAQHRLAHLMDKDESLLEFDLAFQRGAKVALLASDRALYVEHARSKPDRLPLTWIRYFVGTPGEIRIFGPDIELVFGIRGRSSRGLDRTIREQLMGMPEVLVRCATSATDVVLRYHPWRPNCLSSVTVVPGGADHGEREAEAAMKQLARAVQLARGGPRKGLEVRAVAEVPDTAASVRAWAIADQEQDGYVWCHGDLVGPEGQGTAAVVVAGERRCSQLQFRDKNDGSLLAGPPMVDQWAYEQVLDVDVWEAEPSHPPRFLTGFMLCSLEASMTMDFDEIVANKGNLLALLGFPDDDSGHRVLERIQAGVNTHSYLARSATRRLLQRKPRTE